ANLTAGLSAGLALQVLAQQHELVTAQRLGSVRIEADRAPEDLLDDLERLPAQLNVAPLQGLEQGRQRRLRAQDQLARRRGGLRRLERLDQPVDLLLLDDLANDRLGRWPGRRLTAGHAEQVLV